MTLLVGSVSGMESVWGVLYGGCAALANSGLLAWRSRPVARGFEETAQQAMRLVYRSSIERLLIVAGILALGMGLPGLDALAVLAGFISGQVAWLAAMVITARRIN